MRISDWSSDVCSSDLVATVPFGVLSIMVAMWMLSGSNGESGAADMMPAILLRGFGLGFLFLSITLIAYCKLPPRSEERRGGKECGSTWRSGWLPSQYNNYKYEARRNKSTTVKKTQN